MKNIILAAAMIAASPVVSAVGLSIPGSTTPITFADYSAPPVLTPLFSDGLFNPEICAGGPTEIRATFLGKEAIHINEFWINGSSVLTNLAAAPTTVGPFSVTAGSLDFAFRDADDSGAVPNGGNVSEFESYVVLGTLDESGAFVAWKGYDGEFDYVLGFNDGRQIDADYDDLVVGINAIPEPSTYAMLLAGLGAISLVARRRRQPS